MPNIKSSKKRLLQNKVRRAVNLPLFGELNILHVCDACANTDIGAKALALEFEQRIDKERERIDLDAGFGWGDAGRRAQFTLYRVRVPATSRHGV